MLSGYGKRTELEAGTHVGSVRKSTLPSYEAAVIPDEKLWGYSLNPEHETGKHKARVFASALGIEQQHWTYLHDQIVEGLPESEAIVKRETVRWQNWEVPILVAGRNRHRGYVTTGWVIHAEDQRPKLTTAYVERSPRNKLLLATGKP